MERIVTAAQMKACDSGTIGGIGVPSMVLMERAALACALEVIKEADRTVGAKRILCVVGSGNNGGDGAACARILALKGYKADLCVVGSEEHFTEEMRQQMRICRNIGIREIPPQDIGGYDIYVDCIFGIGLTRDVQGRYADVIAAINRENAYVVAADIPSGIHADTGAVMGCAIQADVTVTMQFKKAGLLLNPGAKYAGRVKAADIGITDRFLPEDGPQIHALLPQDAELLLPARQSDGNKGSFGKILVIAGSYGMCGASYLCALAALRTGAGMVKIVAPEENREILQTLLPEAILGLYEDAESAVRAADEGISWADAVCMGPGLGKSDLSRQVVLHVLSTCSLPLVIDADGLNIIAGLETFPRVLSERVYLTPHLVEMARLTRLPVSRLKEDPIAHALHFAEETGAVVLMKDARTVTAYPDGRAFINCSGNSGMATAGSGDVLSGILTALVGRGCDPDTVAALSAYLHGEAGDRAMERLGPDYMNASDIIRGLSLE